MTIEKITIIGAGNLGFSIAKGLLNSGMITKANLTLAEKSPARLAELKADGFVVTDNIPDAVAASQLILLIVKPWQADGLLNEIAPVVDAEKHILASCITGLSSDQIYDRINCKPALFRIMPNTGIALGESMSCIAPFNASESDIAFITELFGYLGKVLLVGENQMAAGTAVAGCGIAYALRFIRAVTEAGVEVGFSAKDATLMAAQIAKGAAELILQNESHPEVEIDKVTTPKGMTIAALNEMEHNGFSSSIIKGILAAYNKENGGK